MAAKGQDLTSIRSGDWRDQIRAAIKNGSRQASPSWVFSGGDADGEFGFAPL